VAPGCALSEDEELDKGAYLRDIRDQLTQVQNDLKRSSVPTNESFDAVSGLQVQIKKIEVEQLGAKKQMEEMNTMLKKLMEMQLDLNKKLASSDVSKTP